jgi:hypothetical protein
MQSTQTVSPATLAAAGGVGAPPPPPPPVSVNALAKGEFNTPACVAVTQTPGEFPVGALALAETTPVLLTIEKKL